MRWADKFSWAHVDFFWYGTTMCFSGFDACEFFMTLGMQALYILALREQDNFGHTCRVLAMLTISVVSWFIVVVV
jgi:hypothetical protein